MATETQPTQIDLVWARSLVGKDWEIYWEEEGDDTKDKESQAKEKTEGEGAVASEKPPPSAGLPEEEDQKGAESIGETEQEQSEEEESEDEEDVADWYDSTVIGFRPEEGTFQIRFVGDDETTYSMVLNPAIVRPCARAWMTRSRAILMPRNFLDGNEFDFDAWEQRLPVDTAALQDQHILQQWMDTALASCQEGESIGSNDTRKLLLKERGDICRLSVLVRSQIYLRSKLAPVVDCGESKGANGEPAPSETYLNHLVKCLEEIQQLCTWYDQCWTLYDKVVHRVAVPSEVASSVHMSSQTPSRPSGAVSSIDGAVAPSTPDSSLVNVEYVRGQCLEAGRAMLVGLLTTDFAPAGAKRRPVALSLPVTSRKTKRRKVYKASGFLETRDEHGGGDEHFPLMEEGVFMSLKSVKRFVNRVQQEERRWYVNSFLKMLERMCARVQEPVRTWTREVESILGERSDEDESDDSSEEEKENEEGEEARDSEGEEEGDDDMSSDDQKRFYSYDEIKGTLCKAASDEILSKIDLTLWTNKLRQKLSGIEAFEIDGWRIVSHIVDEVGQCTKSSDDVLAGLRQTKEAAHSTNPHVTNVDPLGRGSSRLTRTVIDNAIAVRVWILDLRHVELVRERLAFVQDVVSRAPILPHVPSPPHELSNEQSASSMSSRLGRAMNRVQGVSSNLYSHVHTFNRYDNMLAESAGGLCSEAEVQAALNDLMSTPVISLVEEKLSVRYDILNWMAAARPLLRSESAHTEFDAIAKLKKDLDSINGGLSPTRLKLVRGLEKNADADADICLFAKNELAQFCNEEVVSLEQLFFKANDWRERADSIITALRIHGNLSSGAPMTSHKPVAMVDLKRIDDLLSEYGGLGVAMEERRTILLAVYEEATGWSSKVEQIIAEDTNLLSALTLARDERPKGVLMDPPRHAVDSWIEALDWHNRIILTFQELAKRSRRDTTGPDSAAGDSFSTLIADKVYPIMTEGLEVLALFSQKRGVTGEYSVSPDDTMRMLSRLQETPRLLRPISTAKLEATVLGNTILSRLVDSTYDIQEGSPLFYLLFLVWRVSVIDLLHRHGWMERAPRGETPSARPTLEEAKELNTGRPQLHLLDVHSDAPTNSGLSPFHSLFSTMKTVEVEHFHQLIADGERVEMATRMALSATKDVVRGAFGKTPEVRDHLANMKQLHADFKSRVQTASGLILSPLLENTLDQTVKDLSWLVRTFPYLALHSDEVPDQDEQSMSSGKTGDQNLTKGGAIPWDVLVSLHERLPDPGSEGLGGDVARVSLRVKELFYAANTWQEEVTSQMSLSFRGSKRRAPGSSPEADSDLSRIDIGKLAQLAKHPILLRVSMPRESAVQQVLDKAREFELLLAELLDKDFEGSYVDRAPYPEAKSLVGKKGEFLLYRLTGSPLFASLKSSMKRMSEAAEAVLADTPGKAAFDWISQAFDWICDLKEAVTDTAPFEAGDADRLAIPAVDARRILRRGNELFLGITDDLRRILADHKIFLSTNKQTERLTVVIGKGGALHSLGGTAIKWCPLLLECLKEDVADLGDWEARVVETAQAFKAIATEEMETPMAEKEAIFRWYRFRDKVSLLLDEGRDSLVISPQKQMVSSLMTLQTSLDRWADKMLSKSAGSLGMDAKSFLKARYQDGATAADDRFSLLDSLLNRRQLEEDATKSRGGAETVNISGGSSFRGKARSTLDKAMRKGIQMMGIDDKSKCETLLYCAMKAAEIEEAMFTEFRKETESTMVSEKYADKLRSLRYNLEDTKNPTLCPRVLAGEISAKRLVTMTAAEMASPKVRQTRAKAEEEGKRNITLNPGAMKRTPSKDDPQPQSVANIVKSAMKRSGSPVPSPTERKALLNMALEGFSPRVSRPLEALPPPSLTSTNSDDTPLHSPSPSPRHAKPVLKVGSLPPPPLSAPRPAAVLPTPPSLAVAAAPPPKPPPAAASQPCIQNASGGDTFSISVSGLTMKVSFQLAPDSTADIDGIIPQVLQEKGRLQIEEFNKFVTGKINSGRWTAVPMRMSTVSSPTEYKRFYKDYENKKKRIAMFSIGNDSKLFLVTPKFHSVVKALRGSFESRTSTYAVFLTREKLFST